MDDVAHSEDWRERLHATLDKLIDARFELEHESGMTLDQGKISIGNALLPLLSDPERLMPVSFRAKDLLTQVSSFAADIIGINLRRAALHGRATDGRQQREVLRDWLSMLLPLLELPYSQSENNALDTPLTQLKVWLGLRALDFGEVWPIFRPTNRGNRAANAYSLSLTRLSALEWKRRLLSLGRSEGEANQAITAAYGEQWDTIRKWERSLRGFLGDSYVTSSLQRADTDEKFRRKRGFLGGRSHEFRLEAAGKEYKKQKRLAADLSPSKQRFADRSEK